jgi:hypothetical protein
MTQQLVILEPDAAREDLHARVAEMGGRVVQAYGPSVWIVDVPDDSHSVVASGTDWPGVIAAFGGFVPDDIAAGIEDDTGRLGIAAWNVRHSASFAATRANRVGEGRSWGDEGVEPEG